MGQDVPSTFALIYASHSKIAARQARREQAFVEAEGVEEGSYPCWTEYSFPRVVSSLLIYFVCITSKNVTIIDVAVNLFFAIPLARFLFLFALVLLFLYLFHFIVGEEMAFICIHLITFEEEGIGARLAALFLQSQFNL